MVKLPPAHVRALQLPLAGAAGEVVEPCADLFERETAAVLHDGNDKPLLAESGADADVDRRRDGDAVLLPPAVYRRRHCHRVSGGLHDVGGVAELRTLRCNSCLVRGDGAEIGFEHSRNVRRLANGADHVLGNGHPHAVVRNVLRGELARLGGRRFANADSRRRRHGSVNVLTGNPAVAARALNSRSIDPMLQAGPAHGR